jgi:hypothetical protein
MIVFISGVVVRKTRILYSFWIAGAESDDKGLDQQDRDVCSIA